MIQEPRLLEEVNPQTKIMPSWPRGLKLASVKATFAPRQEARSRGEVRSDVAPVDEAEEKSTVESRHPPKDNGESCQ